MNGLNGLAEEIHKNAVSKGWYEEPKSFGDITALIHSEVSEAFEEHRNGHEQTEIYYVCKDINYENPKCTKQNCNECKSNKPEGIPIELADTIIRVLDHCSHEGIDIDEAIRIKMAFNSTRAHKHGGKKL